jgi:hypothetical protein
VQNPANKLKFKAPIPFFVIRFSKGETPVSDFYLLSKWIIYIQLDRYAPVRKSPKRNAPQGIGTPPVASEFR